MTTTPTVAVVGTGLIGQAWTLVFARAGCVVRIWDGDAAALQRAREMVGELANELQRSGLVDDAGALLSRVQTCEALADALAGVDYVQESLPEVLSIKQDIYARMDTLAPAQAVIGSSTSSIPASAFTETMAGRSRCLVAHPVNPPYLVPVVEVCGAPWTTQEAVQRCMALMDQVGQKPVHVRRELEGFILNRLQGALLREAFRLVEQGYVDVDGLDVTIRDGLGLRWSFMGPFETIDLNAPDGITDYAARYGHTYAEVSKTQADNRWDAAVISRIETERRQKLRHDELSTRARWRDNRLMALRRHQQDQPT